MPNVRRKFVNFCHECIYFVDRGIAKKRGKFFCDIGQDIDHCVNTYENLR